MMPEVAFADWMQMAERIRIFPLVILAAVVILGVVFYFVAIKSKEQKSDPAPTPPPVAASSPPAEPRPTTGREGREPVQDPPVAKDPGEKILEGADGAFRGGMFPTAFKFYKDFELRYAGTEVYDRNIQKVWERIHTSHASSPKEKQEPDTPAYIEARRKLADEWKKIKPLMTASPSPEAKTEVENFKGSLPPTDGRRRIIDAWLEK